MSCLTQKLDITPLCSENELLAIFDNIAYYIIL